MIGSTFSQMANAEKLSPQQLQMAIQHGTIPSYIGIPLLQEKMKQSQEAQALAGGQQKPSIAQQIMQQAQSQQGVGGLPSGLPVEGMAGGGIVAFADGGMSGMDDEEDSYEDYMDAAHQSEVNDLLDEATQALGSRSAARAPEMQEAAREVRANPSVGGLEALALEKNKGHNATERLIQHVMQKETGGLKDRANAVSPAGAMGVMQLMPGTAKDLGVRDPFNAEQNIEGGVKYLAQLERKYKDPKLAAMAYNWGPGNVDKWLMAGADMSKLPRETQGYVKGLAEGGITEDDYSTIEGLEPSDLLEMARRKVAESVPKREGFKAPAKNAPSLSKDAMDRLNEADLSNIPGMEAGNLYANEMARIPKEPPQKAPTSKAGITYAPNAGMGNVTPSRYIPKESNEAPSEYQQQMGNVAGFFGDIGKNVLGGIGTLGKHLVSAPGYGFSSQSTPSVAQVAKVVSQLPAGNVDLLAADAQRRAAAQRMAAQRQSPIDEGYLSGIDIGGAGSSPANMGAPMDATSQASQAGAAAAAPVNPQQEILDILKARQENLGKQREQDRAMALLSAGLGIMGGQSPHALANIGAGAQHGIQSLAQSNAARTAEENAILSGRLGLAKLGSAAEDKKAMMDLRRELANQTNERLTQAGQEQAHLRQSGLEERTRKDLANQLAQMEKLATTRYLAKMKNQIIPGQENVIEAQAMEALYSDPAYRALYKKVHGMDPMGAGGMESKGDNAGWSIKPKS
jgi:hypothetical protein